MTRAEMLALLAKAGITPAATATDAEVKAALDALVMKAQQSAAPPALTADAVAQIVAHAIKANDDAKEKAADEPRAAPAPREKATKNAPVLLDETRPAFTEGNVKDAAAGSGLNFVRLIKAQLTAKLEGEGATAINVLKGWGYDGIAQAVERHGGFAKQASLAMKALGQSILADGGALVPGEYSSEFIALLRNTAVVRRSGARSIPLTGTLTMPKATGAGTAYYAAEGAAITPSQQTVGAITFNERKLTALTPVSNDLIRNASISAEQFILEDLKQVVALREDLAFLFGTGASDTPRGIESLIAAANLVTPAASSAKVPTLAEVQTALGGAMQLLMEGNIPMTRLGWLMTPRTYAYFWNLLNSLGVPVYQQELLSGKLMGHPFIVTNQISNTLDSTADASRLMIVDWDQWIIAESMAVQAEVFPNGVYESGGSVLSGISRDQSVVRLITKHDFNTRYNTAAVSMKIRWGAP